MNWQTLTGDRRVTIAIPVLNEEAHLEACLASIEAQTEPVAEILVIDGGSTDRTRDIALAHAGVRLLDNPRRVQAAALNIALQAATGEIFVRVDGHCTLAPDYVERALAALQSKRAAMVGGGMSPVVSTASQRSIARAMSSPVGAGPARFHVGGRAGWVDTVYLGVYPVDLAQQVGGYREDVGVNEDYEFALRMAPHGGIWFDPEIRSAYVPRASLVAVARQFYRYGRSRAATVRLHPGSLQPRQLAAPALVLALITPARKPTLALYGALLLLVSAREFRADGGSPGMAVVLPAMHLSWGVGFLRGASDWIPLARILDRCHD